MVIFYFAVVVSDPAIEEHFIRSLGRNYPGNPNTMGTNTTGWSSETPSPMDTTPPTTTVKTRQQWTQSSSSRTPSPPNGAVSPEVSITGELSRFN